MLPLEEGVYRVSNASADLRRCATSSCLGGVNAQLGVNCRNKTTGPYCKLCAIDDGSHYFDINDSECLECNTNLAASYGVGGAGVVLGLIVLLLCVRFKPHKRAGMQRLGAKLNHLLVGLSLRAKVKQLLSLYQVVTQVSSVYVVQMPEKVQDLIDIIKFLNINIFSIGLPLQCLGLHDYVTQLFFVIVTPIGLSALILLLHFLWAWYCCCKPAAEPSGSRPRVFRRALLAALPTLVMLAFLVFPSVSSVAFSAFDCEEFDDGSSYLRSDYAIRCDDGEGSDGGKEYARALHLAYVGIGLYPVGVPLTQLLLLLQAKRAIMSGTDSALSNALASLHRDFAPRMFAWEIVEIWKKLFLVGFAALIKPATVDQLVAALVFSLIFLLLLAEFRKILV